MRIGYPCTNLTIGAMTGLLPGRGRAPKEEMEAAIIENLACLARILEFNEKAGLFFFTISPKLIPPPPFPAHIPACAECLAAIGTYVTEKGMRVMTCPAGSSFTPERRAADLAHLASLLDAMGLDMTAKISVRIGGRGDAEEIAASFCLEYDALPDAVTRRLVIRNDRFHTVGDCCAIGRECGVPVAYDHHQAREDPGEAVRECARTWKKSDGVPIVLYGSLDRDTPRPPSIDPAAFKSFLAATARSDIDIMLLFRDRERSALIAHRVAHGDPRLWTERQMVMGAPAPMR